MALVALDPLYGLIEARIESELGTGVYQIFEEDIPESGNVGVTSSGVAKTHLVVALSEPREAATTDRSFCGTREQAQELVVSIFCGGPTARSATRVRDDVTDALLGWVPGDGMWDLSKFGAGGYSFKVDDKPPTRYYRVTQFLLRINT